MTDSSDKLNLGNLSTPIRSNYENKENKEFIIKLNEEIISAVFAMLVVTGFFTLSVALDCPLFAPFVTFSFGIIILIVIVYLTYNKIKIVKDEINNKLYINHINRFCCVNKKYTCYLENIHFDCKQIKVKVYSEEEGNHETYFYRLIIINDFKNPKEIDLNESNINNIPAKIFYYYDSIKIEKDIDIILNKNLNNFINAPSEYDNPLNSLLNENENKNSFIKLSERFATFYI